MTRIPGVSTKGSKLTIDLNIVVTTLFGAFIIYSFNSWATASKTRDEAREKTLTQQATDLKTTTTAVNRIDMTLPNIEKSVSEVKQQVSEVKGDVKQSLSEVRSDIKAAQSSINEMKVEQRYHPTATPP